MDESVIIQFLNSPLAKALADDLDMVGRIKGLTSAMRTNKKAFLDRQQDIDILATVMFTPTPPLRNFIKPVLRLALDQIREVTEWMSTLQDAYRAEVAKWKIEDVETLIKLPTETRIKRIIEVMGSTPTDEFKKLLKGQREKKLFFNDEPCAILQEWLDCADLILAEYAQNPSSREIK